MIKETVEKVNIDHLINKWMEIRDGYLSFTGRYSCKCGRETGKLKEGHECSLCRTTVEFVDSFEEYNKFMHDIVSRRTRNFPTSIYGEIHTLEEARNMNSIHCMLKYIAYNIKEFKSDNSIDLYIPIFNKEYYRESIVIKKNDKLQLDSNTTALLSEDEFSKQINAIILKYNRDELIVVHLYTFKSLANCVTMKTVLEAGK